MVGESVFFNQRWYAATVNDDYASAEAYFAVNDELNRINLVFDFEKGWIPASEAAADALSDEE